ncbi:polysaccharide deacetylase family protein, PEP-CTERM locus subfamily [Roseateles sp. YR242]|uniref:XrtA system polysaccharide deacetylase n=1 Tax=Roseateles sp. YR242 TaxID=1855305 RepID=UPI0008CECAA4|nr:XrtA system polysaccharide deacetylase [Roseateles sp. YR242]SEL43751.1 polysaccharide deacetylase family protein, PEP-CTERM locus subfamily [Roseateles sp. YR242]
MTTPVPAAGQTRPRIRNAMSIDVEDYFQVSAFAPYINRAEWDQRECRVQRNIGRILDLLDARGVKATFFTLGWVAQRYPQLVRDIVARGHELASHGFGHERASDLSPEAFREDILSAKRLLEDLGGVEVKGYRAPSFSIGEANLWAFDVLAECGYRYSSSVYPIEHDHYGMPDSPRFAYEVRPGLIEVPVTTLRFRGRNYPSSGGGWFRLLPYGVTRWMIERFNRIEGRSAVFYFHPWEIDPEQPRIPGIDAKTRFRHYVNIGRTEGRIEQLLADFEWARMDELFLPTSEQQLEAA